MSTYIF